MIENVKRYLDLFKIFVWTLPVMCNNALCCWQMVKSILKHNHVDFTQSNNAESAISSYLRFGILINIIYLIERKAIFVVWYDDADGRRYTRNNTIPYRIV